LSNLVLGSVWKAGILQESHRNFTGISSISQEKRRNGEKIPHSKHALKEMWAALAILIAPDC